MTNNQLAEEQIAQWFSDACMVIGDRFATGDELSAAKAIRALAVELQERRKAAMDSEPVAESVTCWSCRNEVEISAIGDRDGYCPICDTPIDLDEEPYTSPQPAPDREQVRSEHAEWSQTTFGNVGPIGPLKHLSKEALEAASEPGDLSEWADMQFLMWDAQRRAGITDEQITQAMIEKLAVNKLRDWPEPKDGEPRLHIKEQPALVGPEDIPDSVYEILCQACGGKAWMYEEALWNACRAAMLQAGNSPAHSGLSPAQNVVSPAQIDASPAPSPIDHGYRHDCECGGCKATVRICAELCWCRTCRPVVWNDMRFVVCPDCGNKRCPRANDHRNACTGSNEPGQEGSSYPSEPVWVGVDWAKGCKPGNSPVIPDGLIAAVNRLLDSDGSRGCYSAIQCGDAHDEIERLLAAAPQEVQGES